MTTQTLDAGANANATRIDSTAPSCNELVLTRLFEAPRELVWRAWTEREHLMRWSAPQGLTISHCEGEVRVGGAWRTGMVLPDGTEKWVGGQYREVVPFERLVFTHLWDDNDGFPNPETLVTLLFSDEGDKTLFRFHQRGFASQAARDGHEFGWNSCFDRMKELLQDEQNAAL